MKQKKFIDFYEFNFGYYLRDLIKGDNYEPKTSFIHFCYSDILLLPKTLKKFAFNQKNKILFSFECFKSNGSLKSVIKLTNFLFTFAPNRRITIKN